MYSKNRYEIHQVTDGTLEEYIKLARLIHLQAILSREFDVKFNKTSLILIITKG